MQLVQTTQYQPVIRSHTRTVLSTLPDTSSSEFSPASATCQQQVDSFSIFFYIFSFFLFLWAFSFAFAFAFAFQVASYRANPSFVPFERQAQLVVSAPQPQHPIFASSDVDMHLPIPCKGIHACDSSRVLRSEVGASATRCCACEPIGKFHVKVDDMPVIKGSDDLVLVGERQGSNRPTVAVA